MTDQDRLVSLPASVGLVRAFVEDGAATFEHGWSVTAALRAFDASMADEDWEYHATQSAAHAADADGRAIVVVAEVPKAALGSLDDPEPGRVTLVAPIERDWIEAVFVGPFDPEVETYDLAWFARQEIATLLR